MISFSRASKRCAWMLLAGCLPLYGEPQPAVLTLDEVLAKVESSQKTLRDIQCDFEERWTGPSSRPAVRGKLLYKRPHRLRINQISPEHQSILADGDRLLIYTPSAGQELQGSWKKWVEATGFPLPLLSFVGEFPVSSWRENYNLFFGGYDGHLYRVLLKSKKSQGTSLTLWVSDVSFIPVRGESKGPDGNWAVQMSNIRQNRDMRDSQFNLRVPKTTAIVPLSL